LIKGRLDALSYRDPFFHSTVTVATTSAIHIATGIGQKTRPTPTVTGRSQVGVRAVTKRGS